MHQIPLGGRTLPQAPTHTEALFYSHSMTCPIDLSSLNYNYHSPIISESWIKIITDEETQEKKFTQRMHR